MRRSILDGGANRLGEGALLSVWRNLPSGLGSPVWAEGPPIWIGAPVWKDGLLTEQGPPVCVEEPPVSARGIPTGRRATQLDQLAPDYGGRAPFQCSWVLARFSENPVDPSQVSAQRPS